MIRVLDFRLRVYLTAESADNDTPILPVLLHSVYKRGGVQMSATALMTVVSFLTAVGPRNMDGHPTVLT